MTTLNKINQALNKKYNDLELVRGNGYYYFSGSIAYTWSQTAIYGMTMKNTTVSDILAEVEKRILAN